jgi:hypothetical protein
MRLGKSVGLVWLGWLFCGPASGVPYQPGEKASYSITYYGATAGVLDLEVLPPTFEGKKKRTELAVKARTDSIFSLFYRFQNLYRSTLDAESGVPVRFSTTHDETKFSGTVTQEFDHRKNQVRHSDRRLDRSSGQKIEKDLSRSIPSGTQDVVSTFYHLRTLPLEKGGTFDIPVFIGEEESLLRVEVVREEILPTKIGDVPSYVLKPSVVKQGQLKEVPETFVWIAKDKNRAMVKLKAKVKIGSVVGYLRSYEPGKALAAGN